MQATFYPIFVSKGGGEAKVGQIRGVSKRALRVFETTLPPAAVPQTPRITYLFISKEVVLVIEINGAAVWCQGFERFCTRCLKFALEI